MKRNFTHEDEKGVLYTGVVDTVEVTAGRTDHVNVFLEGQKNPLWLFTDDRESRIHCDGTLVGRKELLEWVSANRCTAELFSTYQRYGAVLKANFRKIND